MSYYPREVIDDIRSGNDIVDVIGQCLPGFFFK